MEKLNIEALKRQAKRMHREKKITHSEALNILAREHGYANWPSLMKEQKK